MKTVWSKMPSRWIRDGVLHAFRANAGSGDAAALKLYMALAMFANFRASPTAPVAGAVRLSFSDLEQLCDISRRYIAFGLRRLETTAHISIHRVGRAHRYVLTHYEESGWAKLPRAHLLEDQRFRGVGIRGARHLDALKMYLALVSFRANDASHALLSYDKIEHYTGIARPHIRRAIDVLLNHEWVSMSSHTPESRPQQPMNIYVLRGDFWGRRPGNHIRATASTVPRDRT